MTKQALIIGGAGYIGSHVCLELLSQGWGITLLDDLSSGLKENLFPQARFVEGDLLNRPLLTQLLAEGFDLVVYLAARKAASESMLKPELYCRQNLGGGLQLFEAMAQSPSKTLLFSSTAAVYGDPQYLPLDESHPTLPVNYYGFTKLCLEQNLQWFARLKGLRYVTLRYFNAAGYDPAGRVTGLERNPANLIPVVMEVAQGLRPELLIFGNDFPTHDGTGERDFIHVSDLAHAHSLAAEHLLAGKPSLTLNLGTGLPHTVKEVVAMAERVTGKRVAHQVVPRQAGHPASVWADARLANQLLGWKPVHSSLELILTHTWRAYQAPAAKADHAPWEPI